MAWSEVSINKHRKAYNRIQQGLCGRCGSPRNFYKNLCDSCQKGDTVAARIRTGCNARVPRSVREAEEVRTPKNMKQETL